jgi:uncharacterized protein DUF4386
MTTISQLHVEASTAEQAAAHVAPGLTQQGEARRFDRSVQLLAALCGILSPLLMLFAIGLILGSGFLPDMTAPLPDIAAHLAQHPATAQVWAGVHLEFVGFLLFVVFIAYLWGVLRRAEGEPGWLSALAFAGGLMSVILKVGSFPPMYPVLYHAGQPFDTQLARALVEINIAAFVLQQPALGLMLLATALIVIRTAVLPRWLGYLAALAAALSFAAVVMPGLALPTWLLVFFVWMVGTGIALLRRVGKPQLRAVAAPASAR